MDAQRTPDALSTQAENELICEKLLGWSKAQWFGGWAGNWDRPDGGMCAGTPSFTAWAEAGLILDALKAQTLDRLELSVDDEGEWRLIVEWDRHEKHRSRYSNDGPLAVRKGALSYIEARQL